MAYLLCFLHVQCAYVLPLLEIITVAVSIYALRQVANTFSEFCRAGPRFQNEKESVFMFELRAARNE